MKNNKYRSSAQKNSSNKKWWVLLSLVIVVAVLAILELTNTVHWFRHETPAAQVIKQAGTVNNTPIKDNASAGTSTPKSNDTSNATRTIGGATSTNGSAPSTTPQSEWVTSTSGVITVKQPVANSTFQDGNTLSGTSSAGSVNFRLTDSSVGVIAEGTLNVVNGAFSGKLAFTSHSSTGRLDVFTTNAQGVELNEVQIGVNF